MRPAVLLVLAAGLVAGLPGAPAAAEKPPSTAAEVRGPDNAALLYNRAWLLLGREVPQKFNDAVKPDADWAPDAELIALLEEHQGHLRSVMKASRAPFCDFGVEYDQGFESLIPHVGLLRRDSRMLDADAVRLARAGDAMAAAERLAAMYRMAGQSADDGILISSLVSAAISKAAVSRTGILLDQNRLTPEAARVVLDAARSVNTEDAFGVRAAIRAEGLVLVESARKNFNGPDAGKRFISYLTHGDGGEDAAMRDRIAAMDGGQLLAALEQARGYYTDAVEAWARPDAAQQLEAIAGREDRYGPLASLVAPSLTKSWTSQSEGKAQLKALIDRLEKAAK